ncbi:MAG: HVO_0476 family zinc finger protein [Archaeoglobaceae archaeon]
MRQYIYCDACKEETLHELVREEKKLYRCTVCGTHTVYSAPRELELRAVISRGSRSEVGRLRVRVGELIRKGEEYIVETDDGHRIGEVTSIELKKGVRSEAAVAEDVATVWLRDVGEVIVKFSLHKRSVTTPYKMLVDGETEFEVGEVLEIDGKKFRVHRIKLKEGGVLRKVGSRARARDIKRVYAKYEGK